MLYLRDPLVDELPHHGLEFMARGQDTTWETGTQNHEAIAGWNGFFDYLDECARVMKVAGWRDVFAGFAAHEHDLSVRMLDSLRGLGADVYGPPGPFARTPTVSFNVGALPARQVAEHLAAQDVAVSDGHYYAYGLMMRTLGLEGRGGAVRASAVHYTSSDDVDALIDALRAL